MAARPEARAAARGRAAMLTSLLIGEPVTLGTAAARSPVDLAAALSLGPCDTPLVLAPGFTLLHGVGKSDGRLALRWLRLADDPDRSDEGAGVAIVIGLTAPLVESGPALRVVGALIACLDDPAVRRALAAARTREGLVRVLAPIETRAGESPLTGPDVLTLLGSGPGGLPPTEATRRLDMVGPNRIERVRRRGVASRFLAHLGNFFALLLCAGGGIAFLIGMPQLGWAIFAVIVLNAVFSFLQEYKAERAVEALARLLPATIAATRAGEEGAVPVDALVPGDVVLLEEGDQVPADGEVLEAVGLRIDQAAMTGESHPLWKLPAVVHGRQRVPRIERHELLFAGTAVVSGTGRMVVTATGMATEIGTIARLTQTVSEEPSPLQREMVGVTRIVALLALGLGSVFFALALVTHALEPAAGFVFALGVIVANVPEGLLPTLTLALALGVQRLARQRAVLKQLSAVETLGATTVVCTDKTGTLTEGRMAVRSWVLPGRTLDAGVHDPALEPLLIAATLASQATPEHGDPTEVALVRAGVEAGLDFGALRRAYPLVAPHPFDSYRKRMTVVRDHDGAAVAWVKGAPRPTLELCVRARREGRDVPLDPPLLAEVLAAHDRLAQDGLRMLAVATRTLGPDERDASAARVERDLTFLGLAALWDPVRPDVPGAIGLCGRAGIRVVVVTGDDGLTARAIASHVGLAVEQVVSGDEIDHLPASALRRLVREPGVLFARTSPAQKLAIVNVLRAAGEVVAVTGDGVNDAPAIKAADVGVAMGRRGSTVAKEAADMVVTDDHFASIVSAIRLGRAVYANVGKFVTYIFASNVPELVPFLAFVFLGVPLPLTVMQILAVDLGTDVLPALALGAEPPEPDVMDRPPRLRSERLLTPARLLRAYGFLGVIEAVLGLLAFFWTYWLAGWRPGTPMVATGALYRRATTMTLAAIVAAQIGNLFACRTDRASIVRARPFGNPLAFAGIAAEVAVLLGLILIPPLAEVFGLAPLAPREWLFLLPFPAVVLGLEEIRKAVMRVREARLASPSSAGGRV